MNITPDDMILYRDGDNIMSAGYTIKSMVLKNKLIEGGARSQLDANNPLDKIMSLTIPVDLAVAPTPHTKCKRNKRGEHSDCDSNIPHHVALNDDIYNELMNLANPKQDIQDTQSQSKNTNDEEHNHIEPNTTSKNTTNRTHKNMKKRTSTNKTAKNVK